MTTAEAIARQHQLSVEIDARLREIDVGELEGWPLSDLSTTLVIF